MCLNDEYCTHHDMSCNQTPVHGFIKTKSKTTKDIYVATNCCVNIVIRRHKEAKNTDVLSAILSLNNTKMIT